MVGWGNSLSGDAGGLLICALVWLLTGGCVHPRRGDLRKRLNGGKLVRGLAYLRHPGGVGAFYYDRSVCSAIGLIKKRH
jgi:hypothetical protein